MPNSSIFEKFEQLINSELDDIERLKNEFYERYQRNYRLSVYSSMFVIVFTSSIAVLAQLEFPYSKIILSSLAAFAAILSSIDNIFGCKDRARRHLRASQEFSALRDHAKYSTHLIIHHLTNGDKKEEEFYQVLRNIAEEKSVINLKYLKVSRDEEWIPVKQVIK